MSELNFDSRLNYLKRSGFVGSADLILPAGDGDIVSHTVTHNLGYVPFFVAGANINNTSTVWSNNRVWEGTESTQGLADYPVQFGYWCSTTQMRLYLRQGGGTLAQSGTRTVYWVIYLDYEA